LAVRQFVFGFSEKLSPQRAQRDTEENFLEVIRAPILDDLL
jgi:hypothetical protein